MDNVEKPFTVMEWCAGYGGIGMGLKRVIRNLRAIAYSEIELFGCEILASRMEAGQIDAAPIWTNLKTFPCERFRGMVDLLVAGYPCQPFSAAGKRQGEEDPRHLWPHLQRSISVLRPRWVFCENVAGHLTLGFKDVCHDLDELGYEVAAGLFTAREVGLPHKRQRLFILARDKLGDPKGIRLKETTGTDGWGEYKLLDRDEIRNLSDSTGEGELAHDKSAGTGLDERRVRRQPDEADGEGHGVGQADSDCGGGVEDSQFTELRADGTKQSSDHSGGTESPKGSQEREGEILGDPGLQGLQGELPGRVSGAEGREEPSRRPAPDGGIRSHDLAPAGPGSEQYWWEPRRVLDDTKGGRDRGHLRNMASTDAVEGRPEEPGEDQTGQFGNTGGPTELGNAPSKRPRGGSEDGAGEQSEVPGQGLKQHGHETVAPLGGSPDGPPDRLDGPDLLAAYQSLGSSVHSRVDELRALGNGVIPAVSAKAFLTLYDELTDGKEATK